MLELDSFIQTSLTNFLYILFIPLHFQNPVNKQIIVFYYKNYEIKFSHSFFFFDHVDTFPIILYIYPPIFYYISNIFPIPVMLI
jgi:hypothetical protein